MGLIGSHSQGDGQGDGQGVGQGEGVPFGRHRPAQYHRFFAVVRNHDGGGWFGLGGCWKPAGGDRLSERLS
jgi:hypothetical protein